MGHESAFTTPVVLLHGVGLDKSIWSELKHILDHPTVALDLPGHGEEPPLTGPATLVDLAEDVVRRMPQQPVHLVGFSLGALIAMSIAARHPQRVRTLTCVSAVCDRTEEEAAAVRQRHATAAADFHQSMERALDRWYPDTTPGNQDLRSQTRGILLANDVDSYLHSYAVFADGDQQVAPHLATITAPTLAITGEFDPGSTPEMSHRLASHIPGARVQIVPDAHHMLPVTHTEILRDSLQDLFNHAERSS